MKETTYICVVGLVLTCFQLHSSTASLWNVSEEATSHTYKHNIDGLQKNRPLVIAHRGASGVLPEHTMEAYKLAINTGADVIECDAALSKDGYVVCLHEGWFGTNTKAKEILGEDRMSEYTVDGKKRKDFFTVDFNLTELTKVEVNQRRTYRDQSYNGLFKITPMKDMIKLALSSERSVGVHVELKDPEFFNEHVPKGHTFEEIVIKEMLDSGCENRTDFRCFVQSFSLSSLQRAHQFTNLPLLRLTSNDDELEDEELDSISKWLYGVGPSKKQVLNKTNGNNLIQRCHDRGLKVHVYTFRNEDKFLDFVYAQDPYNELAAFYNLHIDAYFTDFPKTVDTFFKVVSSAPHLSIVGHPIVLALSIVLSGLFIKPHY